MNLVKKLIACNYPLRVMTHNYQNFKAWALRLIKLEHSMYIFYSPFSLSSCSLQKKKNNKMLYYFTNSSLINIININNDS